MTTGQGRLFGGRAGRVARARRGCDRAVAMLRAEDRLDPSRPDLVAVARTLADAIDRVNLDPDGSEHVLSTIAARYLAVMDAATGGAPLTGDPFGNTGADDGYPALRDTADT